jgi:hypothetical protein
MTPSTGMPIAGPEGLFVDGPLGEVVSAGIGLIVGVGLAVQEVAPTKSANAPAGDNATKPRGGFRIPFHSKQPNNPISKARFLN